MFRAIVGSIALCASVLTAQAASAGTVRFPETGLPAMLVTVPDGWIYDGGDGVLTILSREVSDGVPVVVLNMSILAVPEGKTLDDAAAAATVFAKMGAPAPAPAGTYEIAGYPSQAYAGEGTAMGHRMNVFFQIAHIDATHILSVVELDNGRDAREARHAARAARRTIYNVQIVTQ
jgi:hypothetical protein